jgi:hypothetical protein
MKHYRAKHKLGIFRDRFDIGIKPARGFTSVMPYRIQQNRRQFDYMMGLGV